MSDAGERAMVEGLREGRPGAFDLVYACYRSRLYGFLLRLSGRRDVAEDLFQETFLRLARFAPTLRADTDLAAWLFTVARNAYRSHRRWAMVDITRLAAWSDATALAEPPPLPDTSADQGRQARRVERALAALSTSAREALLLVYVEGLEQECAALVVGVTYAAFRQRLARAREQLQAVLEREQRRTGGRVSEA